MKLEFALQEEKNADDLTNAVLDIINDSGVRIIIKGGGKSRERGIAFRSYDFKVNRKKVGHFEYELIKGDYKFIFEFDVPEIYTNVADKISALYPRVNLTAN